MTRRALFLGLLCAVLLNGVTYFNDFVLRQNYLIGTQMPIAVYGVLVLFLIGVYPVLNRWISLAALSASEITVILAMTLVACAVPSTNLMRGFAPTLMMPHHYNRINPGWAESGLLEQAPGFMHPQTGDRDDAQCGQRLADPAVAQGEPGAGGDLVCNYTHGKSLRRNPRHLLLAIQGRNRIHQHLELEADGPAADAGSTQGSPTATSSRHSRIIA